MCSNRWKREFRLRNVLFGCDDYRVLHLPQWGRPSIPVLGWRFFSAAYFLALASWSMTYKHKRNAFLFLTTWSIVVQTITFVVKAIADLIVYLTCSNTGERLCQQQHTPFYSALVWTIQNVCQTLGLIVTVVYWAVIYPNHEIHGHALAYSLNTHLINFIIILVDFVLIGIPIRLLHCYQPQAFGLLYSLGLVVAWRVFGEDSVYVGYAEFEDAPVRTAIFLTLLVVVVLPCVHLVWFLLYLLKVYVYSKGWSTSSAVVITEVDTSMTNGSCRKQAHILYSADDPERGVLKEPSDLEQSAFKDLDDPEHCALKEAVDT